MAEGDATHPLRKALLSSRATACAAASTQEERRLLEPVLAQIDRTLAQLDAKGAAPRDTASPDPAPPDPASPDSAAPETAAPETEGARREQERRLALTRAEQVLQAVIRSSQHGIIVCNAEGQLVLHNVAAERIWAGSATTNSVAGWGQYRAFHADGRPYEPADWAMARSLATGEVVVAEEVHFQRFDDSHGILLGSSAPIYDADGAIEGAISTFADITRFKQLEVWLSTTLRSITDGVIATDKEGRIEFMNAIAEKITGHAMAAAKGRRVEEIFHLVDETTLATHAGAIERALHQGAATEIVGAALVRQGGAHDVDANGPGPGGDGTNAIRLDQTTAPIRGDDGQVHGAVIVLRDVTAKRRAEREIAQLYREAQRVNRIKDEFLATLSHELRTPLHAILGWARLLRRGKLDEGARARGLETIERNALTQARLIDDLLDVSRIISGKFQVEARTVELPALVEAALESVRLAADAKSIDLGSHVGEVPTITGDPTRLQQVVWNLLANAIKFTPKGGRVDVSVTSADANVEIQVADTGEGIRADFLPYVFDRFRQADGTTTRAHGGLGLGLAIVRHLVEMHGGSVRVHSEGEGRGATFIVRLPKESPQTTENGENAAKPGKAETETVENA